MFEVFNNLINILWFCLLIFGVWITNNINSVAKKMKIEEILFWVFMVWLASIPLLVFLFLKLPIKYKVK